MTIALLRQWLGPAAPSPHDTELRRLVRDALIEHDALTTGLHVWTQWKRDGWTICRRCGKIRNYDREPSQCAGVLPSVALRAEGEAP